MARTLKTLSDTNRFILVRASEPYVQQYNVLCVRNAQLRVSYNRGIEGEIGRALHGAILRIFSEFD